MSWGLENRLARIIRPETGRTVMLAIDHGYFLGPTTGLESPSTQCAPLAPLRRHAHADAAACCATASPRTPARRSCCASPAARACCRTTSPTRPSSPRSRSASASTPPAWRSRSSSARRTSTRASPTSAKLVDEGERYGIPVLAVTAVGKEMGRDARYLVARLPHLRRDGRAHRQDLLLRGLREGQLHLPGAGRRRRRQEAARARGARADGQRHRRRRRRRRHGPQHLPGRVAGRHDPGRARGRARQRHRRTRPSSVYREQKAICGCASTAMAGAALDDERKI